MKPNSSDPVIDEIRAIRHRISARFDHDPERLMAYYIALQQEYRDRLIETGRTSEEDFPIRSRSAESLENR
jgi:hypothetical protein